MKNKRLLLPEPRHFEGEYLPAEAVKELERYGLVELDEDDLRYTVRVGAQDLEVFPTLDGAAVVIVGVNDSENAFHRDFSFRTGVDELAVVLDALYDSETNLFEDWRLRTFNVIYNGK